MSESCFSIDQKNYIDKSIDVIEARLDGIDKATIVKTAEIDRRLAEHNELRKEVLTDRQMFLRSETFDLNIKAINVWKTEVNDKLTKLMTKYETRMTTANWIAIGALIITVINLIVLIFYFKGN